MPLPLADRIAQAERHVAEGRRIVERQRRLTAEGGAGPDADSLLQRFEQSLAIFEEDLARLLKQRDSK